ncbi:HAD family hydrolase [Candidatus Nitrosacidococcus tergens]|uniref:HAD-superfamily hydrolase, subfamily IA, variant 1 n=1 Tax=Candidatus Nitrosacidococcus tergens TaxID=553981 RepID=A0A7G1Q9M6_9GAMM|nr:HAD-IA family hydrolase [Candidatus Nitrosacidococcus tergens]CAB1275871.1 HAD-superfamily hydrolase, subfamily IA, variant 1 [Candidatus Nitrosacidococcus tergens]
MRSYKLIVFDWDGTLMDSERHIVDSMRKTIQELDLPQRTDSELRNVIGLGLKEALYTLYPNSDSSHLKTIGERYRFNYFSNPSSSQLFDGVPQLLAQLHKHNYLMAIATGKGRSGLNQALSDSGVKDYFYTTRCAEETESKPSPKMLQEIMEDTQVDIHETLMVGDTEYDILMAKNVGVDALAVSYGVHEKKRLEEFSPIDCLDSVIELHHWLLT